MYERNIVDNWKEKKNYEIWIKDCLFIYLCVCKYLLRVNSVFNVFLLSFSYRIREFLFLIDVIGNFLFTLYIVSYIKHLFITLTLI